MRAFFLSIVLLSIVATLGCTGTSIGNPPGAEIKLGVVARPEPAPAALEIVGGISIEQAWITLHDVDLQNLGMCTGEDDMDYDAPDPIAADLLTGDIYPQAPEWVRPGNEAYCALQTKLEPLDTPIQGSPVALDGHTVFVTGTRSDSTPFELRGDFSHRLDLGPSAAAGFVLGTGKKGILITFDVADWLDPSQLDAAEVSNGVILIDGDHNTDLANNLEERIPQSAVLFRDGNRDGMLNENDENEPISD